MAASRNVAARRAADDFIAQLKGVPGDYKFGFAPEILEKALDDRLVIVADFNDPNTLHLALFELGLNRA